MQIEFIYFDVGGVVALDFSKTNKWDDLLNELGVKESDKESVSQLFDKEETDYCLGKKDVESFLTILKEQFNVEVPAEYSLLNGFVKRFEKNGELGQIIVDLAKKYRVGLLTNMYPRMLEAIEKRGLLPDVQWDQVVDSSEFGFAKPSMDIFDFAAWVVKTHPSNILFVENSVMHVDGASKAEWNTFLYDPSDIAGSNDRLLDLLNA